MNADEPRACVVYLLSDTYRRSYVGYTVDLPRRLRQHQKKLAAGARATRGFAACRLEAYISGLPTIRTAQSLEWHCKRQGRKMAYHATLCRLPGVAHRRLETFLAPLSLPQFSHHELLVHLRQAELAPRVMTHYRVPVVIMSAFEALPAAQRHPHHRLPLALSAAAASSAAASAAAATEPEPSHPSLTFGDTEFVRHLRVRAIDVCPVHAEPNESQSTEGNLPRTPGWSLHLDLSLRPREPYKPTTSHQLHILSLSVEALPRALWAHITGYLTAQEHLGLQFVSHSWSERTNDPRSWSTFWSTPLPQDAERAVEHLTQLLRWGAPLTQVGLWHPLGSPPLHLPALPTVQALTVEAPCLVLGPDCTAPLLERATLTGRTLLGAQSLQWWSRLGRLSLCFAHLRFLPSVLLPSLSTEQTARHHSTTTGTWPRLRQLSCQVLREEAETSEHPFGLTGNPTPAWFTSNNRLESGTLLRLRLTRCRLTTLQVMAHCTALRVLDVSQNQLVNLAGLQHLTALVVLKANVNPGLCSLTALSEAPQAPTGPGARLKVVELRSTALVSAQALAGCCRLTRLDLSDCHRLASLPLNVQWPKLKQLKLSGTLISNLSALTACDRLEQLYLDRSAVQQLDVLARLPRLHTLSLSRCRLQSLQPLGACTALSRLVLPQKEGARALRATHFRLRPVHGSCGPPWTPPLRAQTGQGHITQLSLSDPTETARQVQPPVDPADAQADIELTAAWVQDTSSGVEWV